MLKIMARSCSLNGIHTGGRGDKIDWTISITSCFMLWLMGSKSRWGPRIGILNQFLWYYYAISLHEFGLLLGVTAYTIIHTRNLFKWERQDENSTTR